MASNAPSLWQGLRTEFPALNERELKAALCRVQHYERQDVTALQNSEVRIKDWLAQHGERASKVYQWKTRSRQSPYAERYTASRLQEKWRKLVEVQTELLQLIPDGSVETLRRMVHRVSRWQYGEVKSLSPDEQLLHEKILHLNMKACTLYEWMVHTVVPDDYKRNLEQGTISVASVKRLMANREVQRKVALEITLLEDARKLVQQVLA